jgi:hypothetical protein
MSDLKHNKSYFQCICGHIHCSNINYNQIKDELYIDVYCSECRAVTSHLYVGNDILERYELYDVVSDDRYYTYHIEQSD